jgi:hypothetical protein
MVSRKTLRYLGILALVGPALMLAVACTGDNSISKAQYDKVRQQLQDTQNQQQQLQAQLAAAQKGGTPAAAAAAAPSPAGTAASAPAAAAAQPSAAAGASNVKLLLGSVKVTPAPPAPTPTPLPPGVTPQPKATPPASLSDSVGPFYVYVEVLATTSPGPSLVVSNVACTPSSVFSRGQKIIWRYEIVDISSGKRVTNNEAATVKVLLPNDIQAAGSFSQRGGGHAPDAPWMWSSNWEVPQDFPLGAVPYSVQITMKDGRSFTWSPPVLAAPDSDSRPKVVA